MSTATTNAEVVSLLERGLARIRSGLWCKGAEDSFGPATPRCALSTLFVGRETETSFDRTAYGAGTFLYEALPSRWRSIVRYNDHPTTTQADIEALYERAITLAKEAT